MLRINARLDDSYSEKLEYLKEATGLCLSDVVRESVDQYYAQVKSETARRRRGLGDLVGAFEGREDTPTNLSAEYKGYLWMDDQGARTTE